MSPLGPLRYRLADHAVPPTPRSRRAIRGLLRPLLRIACWLYVAGILALYGAARWASPESWMAHLIFFGPRWIVSVPALGLVPLAVRMRLRPETAALAAATLLFVFGIWGFNVPYRSLLPSAPPPRPGLRVLTCNVQGGDLKVGEFAELVRETWPDIVLLQEYGSVDPHDWLQYGDWSVRTAGEFCVASRHPIESFEVLDRPDKRYRTIAVRAKISWSGRTLPVASVHLMTPRRGIEAILGGKWRGIGEFREIAAVQRLESGLVRRWVGEEHGSVLIAGDFNLTTEHALFRREWSSYTDAFAWAGWGLGRTFFTNRIGLRIDHVLCGPGWRPIRCRVVDTDVGSAHRAVIADLVEDGPRDEDPGL